MQFLNGAFTIERKRRKALRQWTWLIVFLFAGILPASAQGKRAFEDLGRYLRAGDTVFVVERAEGASKGVVSRVTATELFVSVSGYERRVTKDTVAWIEASPDPVWDGAALGGVIGLALGITPMAFGCVECGVLTIAGGAAVGAALDAAVAGKHLVYGERPGLSFMRRPVPVSSLGDLWSRVPPGESIRVRDASGEERTGRFVRASRDELTIETDRSTELVIPAERVCLVQRRSYVSGTWIWIGMTLGGVVGALKEHDEYNRHATREDAGKGVLLGGLIGLSLSTVRPRHTDVYRAEHSSGAEVAVGPAMGLGGRGVALTVRF